LNILTKKSMRIIKLSSKINYKNIKQYRNQAFNEWLNKKQGEKSKTLQIKQKKEEIKVIEKEVKEKQNYEKIDNWIKRQAEVMEKEIRMKKLKEEKLKEEQMKKQREEAMNKARAHESYKLWLRKKEEERKFSKQNTNNNFSSCNEKPVRRNSSFVHRNKTPKVVIGPYTNARELKEIQRKINLYSPESATSYEINQKNSYPDEENNDDEEEQENKMDSEDNNTLQELSSIKKDTPVDERDDY
jgi:hypothetical protein